MSGKSKGFPKPLNTKKVFSQLDTVGVTGHVGEAGYYFMPDFSVIRDKMLMAGIKTGQQMCDDMLDG